MEANENSRFEGSAIYSLPGEDPVFSMENTVVIVNPCDRGWVALVILGVISLLFGFLMMLFPKTTTIAVVTLIGVLIIILGVIMLLASLLMPAGASRSTLMLLGGLAGILIGVGIIVYPILAGSILTEIIGAAIFIIGMMQMLFGLIYEGDSRRTLYFIAGLLSIIFALLIIFYPLLGEIVLFGYLIGIYFIILGITMAIAGYLSHCICTRYTEP